MLNNLRLDLDDMFSTAAEFYGARSDAAACTRTLAKFSETYIEEFSRRRAGATQSNHDKKEAWDERFKREYQCYKLCNWIATDNCPSPHCRRSQEPILPLCTI